MSRADRRDRPRRSRGPGAGDFDAWLALHSDDCEFVPLIVGAEGGEPALRLHGRGRDSGRPSTAASGRLLKTREGKAVWWCIYGSEQEALDAL